MQPTITFRPMTRGEFATYTPSSADAWSSGAMISCSIAQYLDEMAPGGVDTPNEHIYVLECDSREIGILWLTLDDNRAWVSDLEIYAQHRNCGYGTAVMLELDAFVQTHFPGVKELVLQVHGDNSHARHIYAKCGFAERTIRMTKRL